MLLIHALLIAALIGGAPAQGRPGLTGRESASLFANAFSTNFDGSNDYVVIPTGPMSDIDNAPNAAEITISLWVNKSAESVMLVFDKRAGGETCCQYVIDNNTGFELFAGGVTTVATSSASTATWHHVLATVRNESGTYKGRIALDGATLSSSVNAGSVQSVVTWLIGARWNTTSMASTDFNFSGKVDELAIFNVGFVQADVTEIYNGGKPNNLRSNSHAANLKHWWRMGDGPGDSYPTIKDQIGTADGTMTNMAGASNFVTDIP